MTHTNKYKMNMSEILCNALINQETSKMLQPVQRIIQRTKAIQTIRNTELNL